MHSYTRQNSNSYSLSYSSICWKYYFFLFSILDVFIFACSLKKFTYLGSFILDDGTYDSEIRRCIGIMKEFSQTKPNIKKQVNFVWDKDNSAELSYNISRPVWLWMLENFPLDEEEAWSKGDLLLQRDAKNTIDRILM